MIVYTQEIGKINSIIFIYGSATKCIPALMILYHRRAVDQSVYSLRSLRTFFIPPNSAKLDLDP